MGWITRYSIPSSVLFFNLTGRYRHVPPREWLEVEAVVLSALTAALHNIPCWDTSLPIFTVYPLHGSLVVLLPSRCLGHNLPTLWVVLPNEDALLTVLAGEQEDRLLLEL